MTNRPSHREDLDRATQARLARLAGEPVDISTAKAALERMIESKPAVESDRFSRQRWVRPAWMGLAASVAIAATLFLILNGTQTSVYASSDAMFQLHSDLVAGRVPVIPVDNIAEARLAIETEWPNVPTLPALPADNLDMHACCLLNVQSRQVVCILLRQDGVPVTVVVARAKDFRSAQGREVIRDGQRYIVQDRDGVHMAMTQHQDRWLCFMGKLPVEELLRLARSVER